MRHRRIQSEIPFTQSTYKKDTSSDRIKQLFNDINNMSLSRIRANTITTFPTENENARSISICSFNHTQTLKRTFSRMLEIYMTSMNQLKQNHYEGGRDENGIPQGIGCLFDPDGNIIYDGYWTHGEIDVRGKLFFKRQGKLPKLTFDDFRDQDLLIQNRVSYTGEFSKGSITGLGQMHFADENNRYVFYGRFQDGLFDGDGIVVCGNQRLRARWNSGVLQN